MSKKLILLILFMSFYSIFCFAQENITITTYYPSPYGSYRELRAQRMAIGDNYSITNQYCWGVGCGTNVIADNHDLIVEGSVSIGPALTAAGITQFTGVGLQIYENTNNSSLVRMMGNRSAASGYANLLEFFAPSSPANANRKNFSIVNKNPSVLPGVNSLQVIANNDSGSFNSDILSIAHDANIWVNGNVGIGVTPPTVRLHLVGPPTGAIRIMDGNQGTGRVLTSDANGVGTWQAKLTCQVRSAGGSSQSASVNCPGGTVMTGGGCQCSGSPSDGTEDLLNSFPSNANTWNCTTSSTDRHVAAYAICCN